MADRDISRLFGAHHGDVFVVAPGTSMAGFDYSQLEGRFTIALNDSVLRFKPTVHIFNDDHLAKRYKRVEHHRCSAIVCLQSGLDNLRRQKAGYLDRVFTFRRMEKIKHLRRQHCNLFVGRTVACAAIGLAWKMGAQRVFLLGVDAYKTRAAHYDDGSPHLKPRGIVNTNGDLLQEERHVRMDDSMKTLAGFLQDLGFYRSQWPGEGVYNLSPLSMITSWPKLELADVLEASPADFNPVASGGKPWWTQRVPVHGRSE